MQFENASQAVALAIRSIFERWTALRLTIEHEHGGAPDKAIQLLDVTVAMAADPNKRHTEDDYIDLFYAEFENMNAVIEDGSPEQVAAHILHIRDAAARGDFGPAMEAASRAGMSNKAFQECVDGTVQSDDDHAAVPDGDAVMNGMPNEPVVDEDGFTEVRRSRRNRQAPERYVM